MMTEMTQFRENTPEKGQLKNLLATVVWPILGLAFAGLCTVAWCCFLLWLFSRFY